MAPPLIGPSTTDSPKACEDLPGSNSDSIPSGPPKRLQVLVQPVVALRRAGLHPGLERPVAILLERQGLHRDVSRHALELEGPDDPLRPDDLPELPVEAELRAVGAALHDPPRPARTEVDVARRDLVPPGAPPVRHVVAGAVGLEHQIAGGVEPPVENDLPFRRRRHREGVTACGHLSSPFLGSPPGIRRAARSSPPRTGGTVRSTRRPL